MDGSWVLLTYTPQNSSTDSKVITSFNRSFQLSPCDIPVSRRIVSILASTKTHLAAGGLGEPQRPPVGKRVLDIEVVLVVEDSLNVRHIVNVG